MAKVLYLSYDGISDPLGQSQILPYLRGLAGRGHEIHLISFEKPARFVRVQESLTATMRECGISWSPLPYTRHPPVLSTVWDLHRLRRAVRRLHREHRFDVVHCRSYVTALIGLQLKRDTGVRLVFDMRGFWADEKVEGGAWNLANPLFRAIYRFFKAREADFVREADAIVTLTHAGRREIERWQAYSVRRPPIGVISCATEFASSALASADTRARSRKQLNIPVESFVVVYLGSLGTWYMVDEMLDWFAALSRRRPESWFLCLTPDDPGVVRKAAAKRGIDSTRVLIVSAARERVPSFLAAANIGLFFIRPTYSKRSSCPTKLGELLAIGLPVVTNAGIGDVEEILNGVGAGIVVRDFSSEAYASSIDQLPALSALDPYVVRTRAQVVLDLPAALDAYDELYRAIVPCAATGPCS